VDMRDGSEYLGPDDGADLGMVPIDWAAFWCEELPPEDYVLEPLVAAGRQTAIYSVAKSGKSLLALDMAAAAACGRSILGQPAQEPVEVMYVDLEMTMADLRERLSDLGYGPDDDLSLLHYYQLPTMPPLDSELGGELLVSIALVHGAKVVVIDTMARAVSGAENDSDTYRSFYAHTGRRLKAAGIALLRLDHMGKDPTQGQRGSSAKVDDVDVVFRMSVDGNRITLHRTHSRIPWVPQEVVIERHEDPVLRHVWDADSVPAGTHEVALLLDDLEVPVDSQTMTAVRTLKAAGKGRRKALVIAAQKYRRTRP